MDRNQAELSKSIKDLQLINSELKNDIKQLMIQMEVISKELAEINKIRYLKLYSDSK
jgi:hypothetical protein